MPKAGRPKKPLEEKFVPRVIRFPPDVWRELEELIPRGARSAFIHETVKRRLQRLRRQRALDAKGQEVVE